MIEFGQLAELALAARDEADQRHLLESGWATIHGKSPRTNRGGPNPENTFVAMLDAGAWESAAIQLVPIDAQSSRPWYWRLGHGSQNAGWAFVNRVHPDHCDRDDEAAAQGHLPAMALLAAAMRAHSQVSK